MGATGRVTALVAGAVAAELIARNIARAVEEPLWWHDRFTQRKELQMRALRRRGGVDMVLLGSSKVLLGLDPDVIAERTGLRCYNASIYRGLPLLSEAWLADRVLPLLRPRFVVVGVSPSELNDNTPLREQLSLYRESRVFTAGPAARAFRRLGLTSVALRYAPLVRRPRRLARALLSVVRERRSWQWRVPPELPGVLGPSGQALDYLDRTYANSPRMRLLYGQLAANYDDGGGQAGALRGMAELCRRSGARMLFVMMPGSREYIEETFEGGRPAWEASKERLRTLVGELGCSLLEVPGDFEGHHNYADMLHLNRTGRDAFSESVAAGLASLVGAESVDGTGRVT